MSREKLIYDIMKLIEEADITTNEIFGLLEDLRHAIYKNKKMVSSQIKIKFKVFDKDPGQE